MNKDPIALGLYKSNGMSRGSKTNGVHIYKMLARSKETTPSIMFVAWLTANFIVYLNSNEFTSNALFYCH